MHAKNKELIVQEGGLPYIIALLRSPVITLQEHSAVIFRNISVNEENEVIIVEEGALGPLAPSARICGMFDVLLRRDRPIYYQHHLLIT